MENFFIDVTQQNCPIPLIEMRKAIKKSSSGDTIVILGTHSASKKEIPMAVNALGLTIENIKELENGQWEITIKC